MFSVNNLVLTCRPVESALARYRDRELSRTEVVKVTILLYISAFIGPLTFIASVLFLSAVLWQQSESPVWIYPLVLLFIMPMYPVARILYFRLKEQKARQEN